jgi:PhzF family phenazine biosynthesis protein
MRFQTAQLDAYLSNDLWLRNARQANHTAARLRAGLSTIPGVTVLGDTSANILFWHFPANSAQLAMYANGCLLSCWRWSCTTCHLEGTHQLTDYQFAQVDVFSANSYQGNPVAVVLADGDVTDQAMGRLARWTNLSETTFLLPPTTPDADYRLRIFTPGGEMPFAGHPTLGSAHAWLEFGGIPKSGPRIVQECGAGLVELRLDGDALSFAAPPTLHSGPVEESYVQEIAAAFGISRDAVIAHQWVDNGPGWAVVQLATAEEVLALEPDLAAIPQAMVGAIGAYPEGSEHAYEMRTFAPRMDVPEDPVCGSMNAGVGQWLTSAGVAPSSYLVSQGTRLGRTGTIAITADDGGNVWVGGPTTTLIRGTITL